MDSNSCDKCSAFGIYCFQKKAEASSENRNCKEAVDRLMETIRWRKFSEEKPEPDVYYVCNNGIQSVDIWTGKSWTGHERSVDYWMPTISPPLVGMALDLGD